jgi:hypothetical protein
LFEAFKVKGIAFKQLTTMDKLEVLEVVKSLTRIKTKEIGGKIGAWR